MRERVRGPGGLWVGLAGCGDGSERAVPEHGEERAHRHRHTGAGDSPRLCVTVAKSR